MPFTNSTGDDHEINHYDTFERHTIDATAASPRRQQVIWYRLILPLSLIVTSLTLGWLYVCWSPQCRWYNPDKHVQIIVINPPNIIKKANTFCVYLMGCIWRLAVQPCNYLSLPLIPGCGTTLLIYFWKVIVRRNDYINERLGTENCL